MLVSIGSRRFDPFADGSLVARGLKATKQTDFEHDQGGTGSWALARVVWQRPALWDGFAWHASAVLWHAYAVWWEQSRLRAPRVTKISFFTHHFMDACALKAERIDACVFMAATASGTMSMCTYNAERDRYLLKPIWLRNGKTWQPPALAPDAKGHVHSPLKWLESKPRQVPMGNGRQPLRVLVGEATAE